ncbi:hypothetical protein [Arsenophonus endosymbiont of Aphis craccivora]|uniref:hypothetical protein n=1 Tax=Arsenophonus endosymbiont of Aphis craccivora TaxID=1231049 RepID=UPI001EE29B03|nr:hypothetical protein [Arsenophonus endosymbiont of Aphis craccivora]
MEKWKSGKVEKWKSGKVEKWKSGKVEKWKSGNKSVIFSDHYHKTGNFFIFLLVTYF